MEVLIGKPSIMQIIILYNPYIPIEITSNITIVNGHVPNHQPDKSWKN
jgi:hypothetical protein